ncbi:MAG: hypothetical protein GX660_25580 [Clostridiaceae bacterium]|nr:hypothetical protein [Clostridiaceae bacterium]
MIIKILGISATILGIGATLLSEWVNGKQLDDKISKKVAETFEKMKES